MKEVESQLSAGLIERTNSEYSSPTVIVRRNGKFRIVIDYRLLNSFSVASRAAVPGLSTLIATWHSCQTFISLDLRSAFWQIGIKESDRDCTAWTIPSIGNFRQKVMSLGLKGSPATMQSVLDKTLEGLRENVAEYLDDIILGAPDFDMILAVLKKVLERLR